jgi:hypothetical protein
MFTPLSSRVFSSKLFRSGSLALASLLAASSIAVAQDRPPAVPLVVANPFFSLWSMSDKLTDSNTKHWTEVDQPMVGLIRIDGELYRYMGNRPKQYWGLPEQIPAMTQTSLVLTPLHTRYTFAQAGVELKLSFFQASFPEDMDLVSRPVGYMTWSVKSTDGKQHNVDVMLDVDPMITVNTEAEPVVWGRTKTEHMTLLNVGSKDQDELHFSGDRVRADWGYFHIAVPDNEGAATSVSYDSMTAFSKTGSVAKSDDMGFPMPATWRNHPAHLAVAFQMASVGATAVERHVEIGYTEQHAIEYLGTKLVPYYARNGMSDVQLFESSDAQRKELETRGDAFDKRLMADMTRVGGADYAYMTTLAFRQTLGAHQLVADVDGRPMLFSKENDSNGCIDTVDVTYPSSPFFLLFNPRLLEAQLDPMMRYAELPRWRFPFAPHDLGTFPLANGQVYGGGERTEDNQMPVEESGDLILMIDALGKAEGNYDFAAKHFATLEKWTDYLSKKGMDPENQLSTDDFAGHLAHNTNLSVKAIEALAAFAQIAEKTGHPEAAKKYAAMVKPLPAKWEEMAKDGDHTRLAFDQPGTWSQEYNLVWDGLLQLHLFPASLYKSEVAFYMTQMKPYGLPLDSRKTYTKLDWELWTATLGNDPKFFATVAGAARKWSNESPSRVPLTDWYDTISGKQSGFQARSVVGGIFLRALYDPQVAKHYAEAEK